MEITFDPAKDAANIAKHGASLAVAPVSTRLYCVVFIDRSDERRIISLRKANKREVKRYVAEN